MSKKKLDSRDILSHHAQHREFYTGKNGYLYGIFQFSLLSRTGVSKIRTQMARELAALKNNISRTFVQIFVAFA